MSETAASRKILFTASTRSHIENFHLPYLRAFEEMGWEVKALALPVSKRFFSLQNARAIFSTRRLLLSEGYDVVSSQSTLAGIVTRLAVILAGKSRLSERIQNPGKQLKIFHTAHGYLFHDDNSLKKWAYLLPEMLCGSVTDVLMVMNHGDLEIAKKYKLCGKSSRIYYIDGMGIDLSRFRPREATAEQKKVFGINEGEFVFVYAAEFSKRKNHQLLLRGFAEACRRVTESGSKGAVPAGSSAGRLKLLLAGDGVLLEDMKALASELGMGDQVVFLGYTKNMDELYPCCNVAVSTSRIEGLPFNIMEAMACGLPVIASDIKGHRELVTHEESGLLFEIGNPEILADQFIKIAADRSLRDKFAAASRVKVTPFSVEKVLPSIINIYKSNI